MNHTHHVQPVEELDETTIDEHSAADQHREMPVHGAHHGHGSHAAHSGHESHGGRGSPAGHSGHGDHAAIFRQRFWISLILSLPVIFYSEMVQHWFGYTAPAFSGSRLIAPVIGTVIFVYGGSVFLRGAWDELRAKQPGMMLLIGLAIGVAYVASLATALGWFHLDFWWELALLIVIMLLGHWLEMRALGQAQGALGALSALLPDDVERIGHGDELERVSISDLMVGDRILIRPGGRVAADGTIVEGAADLDESMLTGESRPVPKAAGDKVVAGSVAQGGALRIRVDATGDATALGTIQQLVEEAQQSHSRAQAIADRFAGWLFYVAAGSALITFIVWAALGNIDDAVVRTVTVLVISCPHALGLAIPLVIAISTSLSARQGILVKDRLALERMRTVDTVLFDKTGTLTLGEPRVTGIAAVERDDDHVLRLAAAVERDSEHPLAQAIIKTANERQLDLPAASDFRAIPGKGVEAVIDGKSVRVGGPALLRERNLRIPEALQASVNEWEARGAAVLSVLTDDAVIGALALEDQVRPESAAAVEELHRAGIRVVMITGDARQVASHIAKALQVDEVFAEVLPEDKESKVVELQRRGERVAMVGDGVNDAPALARADVGIAIGAGTDVAIASAGVVLASNDPRAVSGVIRLSGASYRKMLQNLGWAAGYNLIAIPLAAGVLAPVGFVMPPAIGAALMSLSTIIVAINAQLLRRVRLRPERVKG